jgi:cobalt/nickel transport system permease protein
VSHFIETTLQGFARALSRSLASEQVSRSPGLLQSLDPRTRVVGTFMLVVAVVLSRRISIIGSLFIVAVLLAIGSEISLVSLLKRVWLVILAFTGLIAIPALFITPGDSVFTLPIFRVSVTAQGLSTAALLVLRVETAVTLTTVLVLCTPWNRILKSLRWLRLPAEVVTMVAMTHRYIFLLIETANQMFESRKSRTVGDWSSAEKRRAATRTAGVLLSKSIDLSHDVYLAMLSRGFQGEVQLLTNFQMKARDYLALTAFVLAAGTAVWIGR